jgi:hypothetical protein
MSKSSTTKGVTRKARHTRQNTATKVTAKKGRAAQRKTKVPSASTSNPYRITASDTQVPNSLHSLAEMNVAQTRELYERSKNALRAVFESWEKSFGAASQGAVAFNRRLLDISVMSVGGSILQRTWSRQRTYPTLCKSRQIIGASTSMN